MFAKMNCSQSLILNSDRNRYCSLCRLIVRENIRQRTNSFWIAAVTNNVNFFHFIGTKNYVLVHCPDARHFSCCNILDLNGDVRNILLLKSEKNVLLCGPFKPKSNPFYVQVPTHTFNCNFNRNVGYKIYTTIPDKYLV